jgi:hypothetical protein
MRLPDDHPIVLELNRVHKDANAIILARDAEIACLKSEIEDWKENERRAILLITELADWLEDQIEHMGPDFKKAEQLIQRAREALNE